MEEDEDVESKMKPRHLKAVMMAVEHLVLAVEAREARVFTTTTSVQRKL